MNTTTSKRFPITSRELEEWLQEYDGLKGNYPEDSYQGYDFWKFVCKEKWGEELPDDAPDFWHKEGEAILSKDGRNYVYCPHDHCRRIFYSKDLMEHLKTCPEICPRCGRKHDKNVYLCNPITNLS